MNKAEELRKRLYFDLYENMDKDMATDTLERIDEYAQQVSREAVNKSMIEWHKIIGDFLKLMNKKLDELRKQK